MRREFPARVKVAAFERAKGCCERCGIRLQAGRIEYHHLLADWLGGEPTLENCSPLCRPCHGLITATEDIPRIAKTKRVLAANIGAKRTSRPLPGGRNSPWKRKINGTTERREP